MISKYTRGRDLKDLDEKRPLSASPGSQQSHAAGCHPSNVHPAKPVPSYTLAAVRQRVRARTSAPMAIKSLLLALLVSRAAAAAPANPRQRAAKPHIVMILGDDIGFANVGWNRATPSKEVQTPA